MNKNLYILILIITFLLGCNKTNEHKNHNEQSENKKKIYTCPMHPQIIRDSPINCPICGMKLVEKKNDGSIIKNDTLAILLNPANEYVISSVKTIQAQFKEFPMEINASGKISYDTRKINVVSARVSGRIEKLYVKYRFQVVTKGQWLMDIYSAELVTEQENYIYILNNDTDNESLIKAAENRLLLLGLTPEQLKELKSTKSSLQSVTIYSPYTGHLHDLVSSNTSSNMAGSSESSSQELILKEGMYVEKGQSIFNVYNVSSVWALLNIYPDGANMIKVGQKVILYLDADDSVKIEARIDFIEPIITKDQKTTQARVYLSNTNKELKIGTILKATIEAGNKKGIFIPSTAIINLGTKNVVFVKENNIFRSKQVEIGLKTNLYTEIISGISEESTVAVNAQLLMDSESFIKVAN